MKDRMIIIREKVMFIVTVTHGQKHEPEPEKEEESPSENSRPDISQQNVNLPVIQISAN